MQDLLAEKSQMKRAESERASAISRFEQELAEAVEAMTIERKRWTEERESLSSQLESAKLQATQSNTEVVSLVCMLALVKFSVLHCS